jgi:hypothetical protein
MTTCGTDDCTNEASRIWPAEAQHFGDLALSRCERCIAELESAIPRIKDEITEDIAFEIVSPDVKEWGELDDYVDANTYGGFCDPGVYTHIFDHQAFDTVKYEIDPWLAAGRPA